MGLEEGAEVLGVVDTSLLQIHVEGRQERSKGHPLHAKSPPGSFPVLPGWERTDFLGWRSG